jgi:predicted RNase H-like HicB family nuclease
MNQPSREAMAGKLQIYADRGASALFLTWTTKTLSLTWRNKSENRSMNPADRYHLVVYWSDEDQCYVGLCPDLFYGGTHGDDPEQVFKDLRAVVADVVESYKAERKPLPEPRDLVAA